MSQAEAVMAALQGLARGTETLDAFARSGCPTLIVVGSEDAATTPEHSANLQRDPGSALVVLRRGPYVVLGGRKAFNAR